ncbi:baculoviral IAP repeat-containing protein 5.1-like [Bombina bombina]|uniref:baculoviral IAP repeat-containing protein 5.1-like n=1 Tax=Bombina bombina TaxID=8345 RepID=UPI00235A4E71|nr:baculoviral IAP repeat-containing protein 5.1-like [Bombina bombina]
MQSVKDRFSLACQHIQKYVHMYDYNNRLKTFSDWPFTENCKCTPENMAKAGFVHCPSENEPDIACCFFCLKELEGWEPDDDPWTEHFKRSANCGFLSLSKSFDDLTMEECLRLELDRVKCFYRKFSNDVLRYVEDEMAAVTKSLLDYFSSQHNCSIDLDL